MQMVTAATPGYLEYLVCHLGSLEEHSNHNGPHTITVLHRDLSPLTIDRLTQCFAPVLNLRWIEPTGALLESIGAPLAFASASPHYFRLLAQYIIPASRAIYCDVDTIVTASLDPLWNMDLEDTAVAATQDYLPHIPDAVGNWRELGLNPDAPYLNSGVLVLDLDYWRERRIAENVLSICNRYPDQLFAHRKWPQFDQYGLNVFLNGQWKFLEREWNHGADLPLGQYTPRIVHFVGNGKVHLETCQTHFRQIFDRTLRKVASRGLV